MDFNYVIIFHTEGKEIHRAGQGLFYPHDGDFNLEHMIWQMTEEFGRPSDVEIHMEFIKALTSGD